LDAVGAASPAPTDEEIPLVENHFDRQLGLVLDGRIRFDAFACATRREFERMAGYLLRRWLPPAWYTTEDVVQELLLGAHICMWEWSPVMGPSLSRYVVFNAMSHAKRALHKARGAKLSGTSDRNPSHIERPLSSFGFDNEGDAMAEAILAEEPVAETMLIEAEEREVEREAAIGVALDACKTEVELAIVMAIIAAEDLSKVSADLYDDIDCRIQLRLGCEQHADRVVARIASVVVSREVSIAS
jgi:DNA-directed RNA polymerase specialized sigma24 family protein